MRQFPKVNCSCGAPMGRPNWCDDPTARVYVFRVRLVGGDYDDGGAYWGGGYGVLPLYCARDSRSGEKVQVFMRAFNREDAIAQLRRDYPGLRVRNNQRRKSC